MASKTAPKDNPNQAAMAGIALEPDDVDPSEQPEPTDLQPHPVQADQPEPTRMADNADETDEAGTDEPDPTADNAANGAAETPDESDDLALPSDPRNPALEFVSKTNEKRKLENALEKVKAELTQLEPEVIDQLNDLNMTRMTTTLGATVHLQTEVLASLVNGPDGTKDQAHQALRDHDLEYLVKEGVNAQSLKAYVAERKKYKEEIPEGLLEFIKVTERPRARVRAS